MPRKNKKKPAAKAPAVVEAEVEEVEPTEEVGVEEKVGLDALEDVDEEVLEEAVAAGLVKLPEASKPAIYNKEALLLALDNIAQPSTMPFVERMAVSAEDGIALEDPDDDLQRETLFYNQALAAVKAGRVECEAAGIPHFRPPDYFAEMAKDDTHMQKVKSKLLYEQRKIAAFEQRRREQESRKFAKELQAERTKQKAAEKRDTLDAVKAFRRRKDKVGNPMSDKDLDMMLSNTKPVERKPRGGGGAGGGAAPKPNWRRELKNKKFGSGGAHSKRGGVGGPGKRVNPSQKAAAGAARPGKRRRENARRSRP